MTRLLGLSQVQTSAPVHKKFLRETQKRQHPWQGGVCDKAGFVSRGRTGVAKGLESPGHLSAGDNRYPHSERRYNSDLSPWPPDHALSSMDHSLKPLGRVDTTDLFGTTSREPRRLEPHRSAHLA